MTGLRLTDCVQAGCVHDRKRKNGMDKNGFGTFLLLICFYFHVAALTANSHGFNASLSVTASVSAEAAGGCFTSRQTASSHVIMLMEEPW